MDTQSFCQNCQTPLAADAPGGLCPACLMKVALATGTGAGQEKPGFTPPTIEELARKFPQLEIIELIGRGGMGAVYKARQKELDRLVALKILPPGIGEDAAFAQRFTREAKALARLNHPGIVTIHDSGRADGLYFFVMESVDGVNLRQLLATGRVSPREALAIVPQICDALQFAHDQGIVHRDIKPENILLDRRGRVKVADFGLAKIVAMETSAPSLPHPMAEVAAPAPGAGKLPAALTDPGKVMGTPAYMAPEQIRHPDEVDHRADIYALGVVFYQMLTGELPGQRIEAPSRKVHIDVRLDAVVLRALEKTPEFRWQTAEELRTRVETIATDSPPASPVDPADMKAVTAAQSSPIALQPDTPSPALTPQPQRVRVTLDKLRGLFAPQASTPSNNFSPRAQHVLALARLEAARLNHNFVGTEHLLLGLIKLGQGTAFHVFLQKFGLDLESVRKAVEKAVGIGPDQKLVGNIPYTPRVKKVLALAVKEARNLKHTYVGTEHILLGLLQEGDGVAAAVLRSFQVDVERMRQAILKGVKQPVTFPPAVRPVELKFKWPPPGKRIVFAMDFQQNTEPPGPSAPDFVPQDFSIGLDYGFTVLNEIPDGGHEVEMEFLAARMSVVIDGTQWRCDSANQSAADQPNSPLAAIIGKIVGSKIRYFLNPSHQVQRMEGVAELVNQLNTPAPAEPFGWLRSLLTEASLKRTIELNRYLPSIAVLPGDVWPFHEEHPSSGGTVATRFAVFFESWERRGPFKCARLKFRGTTISKAEAKSPPASGMVLSEAKWVEVASDPSFFSLEGKTSGVTLFDPQQGLHLETTAHRDLHITNWKKQTRQRKQVIRVKLVSVE